MINKAEVCIVLSSSKLRRCRWPGYWLRRLAVSAVVLLCTAYFCIRSVAMAASPAVSQRIAILQSGSFEVYERAANTIVTQLAKACEDGILVCPIPRFSLDEEGVEQWAADAAPDLLVTLGRKAALFAARSVHNAHLLHALIPQSTYAEFRRTGAEGAVYLDQPWSRQLRLIQLALPGLERVGLLLSVDKRNGMSLPSAHDMPPGLRLLVRSLDDPRHLGPALQRLYTESDVLLAVPDASIHNARSAVNLLMSSYRARIPVVAFSEAYVSAGALAAVYSTPEQIGRQVGELLSVYLDQPDAGLPAPEFPKYFSVSVNHAVARALKLKPLGAAELEQLLRKDLP